MVIFRIDYWLHVRGVGTTLPHAVEKQLVNSRSHENFRKGAYHQKQRSGFNNEHRRERHFPGLTCSAFGESNCGVLLSRGVAEGFDGEQHAVHQKAEANAGQQ